MNDDSEKLEKDENELEKNINDLKEWEDNQYNPGYYIGSGRVPRPISCLSRYPLILIIFGTLGFLTNIVTLFKSKISFNILPGLILGLLFFSCFIYGGVARIKKRKN